MNIREATVDDARIIAQLNLHVQQVHADAEPSQYKQAVLSDELIALYREWLNGVTGTIFLAEDDNTAVGYIYAVVRQRPENLFRLMRRDMLIDQMSVNPEYYGTGVAEDLMQYVINLAQEQNINRIILDVLAWNSRAIRFYEKQGFTTSRYHMQMMLE